MFKVLIGVISFSVILFFASLSFAHADSNDDFTMGTILTEPIHYSLTTFSDNEILSYDANTDVCQYWSVSSLGDWYYGIVINPIVTYDIIADNPAKVVECSSNFHKFN